MADNSVSDFSSFINRQINFQERVESCLWKLEALTVIAAMSEGFYDFPESILRNYFSIAVDLIENAKKSNQISLNALFKKGRV